MSLELLLLLAAVTLAGATNMAFVKSAWLGCLRVPMDRGLRLADGRRLLGDSKTWKGFLGMIALTALITGALGALGGLPGSSVTDATLLGAGLGFAYVAAELPNSFLKRRLGIAPGALTGRPGLRRVQLLVDQADSVVGCCAVLAWAGPHPARELLVLALLAVAVHFAMNGVLYALRLKSAWT